MPAQSKQQQKFMGMVHALKKGDMDPSDASPELKKAADSMSDTDAKDFASTPHKGLPKRVKQEIVRKLKEYAMTLPGHHAKSAAPMDSLRSDDEMDVQETRIPQNFNVGTTQDYHTKLATTPRKKYDKTNFDPEYSGQEDLEEAGLKGIENIPSNKKLSQLSDNEKLSIIQSVGNIISFYVPDWAKGRYKFWQVISAGKVKKGKSLSGETQYFLQGKGPQKASPTYKSVKDLINGVDWNTMELRRESVNESKDEVTPTQLVKIQSDIRKINPKIRVYISKHPVTSGKLQIQLGSSHPSVKGDDTEIHKIYKVLKKHTGDWRTGTMFVESVNESADTTSLKKIHDAVFKFLKTKKGVGEIKEFPEFPNRYGDNVSTFSVKYNIEDKYNYDLQEIKIEYSTSRVFIPNKGYFSFKTFNDIKNIINKKSSLKESVNESSKEDIIKDLDKAKNDLLKKVNILIDKKKKLYSNVDIESPMSADEKKLDKDIADLFSQLNKLVLQKRSLKEASFHALNNPRMKKSLNNLVKDKKVQNPETGKDVALQTALSNNDHPAHDRAVSLKQSLLQKLKGMMKNEYASNLDNSYILNKDAKLDGTPEDKKAIGEELSFDEREMVIGIIEILKQVEDRKNRMKIALNMLKKFKEEGIEFDYQKFIDSLKEYSMGSYEYDRGNRELGEVMIMQAKDVIYKVIPNRTFARYANNPTKNREFVDSIIRDFTQVLNRFYKQNDIDLILR